MVDTSSTSADALPDQMSGMKVLEFTCATCQAKFDSNGIQRAHMKGDWHIYNLKRRIASLPSISYQTFNEKVLGLEPEFEDSELSGFEETCTPCKMVFTNSKAWRSHCKSRSHNFQKSTTSDAQTSTAVDGASHLPLDLSSDDEEELFNPSICLFCNLDSLSLDASLKHMASSHSFFIPDMKYLIDAESLISYLHTMISQFNECLFCGLQKSSKLAVQDHMRGKGHCKINSDTNANELEDFYDFSAGQAQEEEEEEEDEEDEEEVEGESREHLTLVPEDNELRLPSGKTLGHRSGTRRFRQRIPVHNSSDTPKHQALTENDLESNAVLAPKERRIQTRAGTSTSLIGVPELQQRALLIAERRMLQMETRARNEFELRLVEGGNKPQKVIESGRLSRKARGYLVRKQG